MSSADKQQPQQPNIADPYRDLLAHLDVNSRRGVVQQLADGYYQGWRPTRAELAILISRTAGEGNGPSAPGASMATHRRSPEPRGTARSFATNQRSSPSRAKSRQGALLPASATLPTLASFDVDCGELLPHFRFVATSLTHDGTTVRDRALCRMIWLNYALIPSSPAAGGEQIALPPVFAGPILCTSDTRAQNSHDGRRGRHSPTNAGVAGSRGAWPLIMTTRQMKFLIGGNPPATNIKTRQRPAGFLVVDIGAGSATWYPRI